MHTYSSSRRWVASLALLQVRQHDVVEQSLRVLVRHNVLHDKVVRVPVCVGLRQAKVEIAKWKPVAVDGRILGVDVADIRDDGKIDSRVLRMQRLMRMLHLRRVELLL